MSRAGVNGVLTTCRPQGPQRRNAAVASICAPCPVGQGTSAHPAARNLCGISAAFGPAGLQGTVAHGRGERRSRFLHPPALTKAQLPLPWQGPSPLPQRCAGIRTGRGPKPPGQRPTRPLAGAGLAYACRTYPYGSAVPDRAGPVATGRAPAHPLSAATGPPVLSHCGLRQSGWTRSASRTNTGGMPAGSGRGNPGAAPVPVPVPVKRSTQRDISA